MIKQRYLLRIKKKKKNWISCQNCKERFVQAYEKHTTVPISAYDSTRPFSRTGWSVPKGWPYYPSPTETLWGWLAARQGDVRPAVKEDHLNTSPPHSVIKGEIGWKLGILLNKEGCLHSIPGISLRLIIWIPSPERKAESSSWFSHWLSV